MSTLARSIATTRPVCLVHGFISKDAGFGVREAEAAVQKAKRARQVARRARWRSLRRALSPRTLYRRIVPDRLTGLPAAVWLLLDSWPVRIGLTVLAVVAVPVLSVVAFDRRTR